MLPENLRTRTSSVPLRGPDLRVLSSQAGDVLLRVPASMHISPSSVRPEAAAHAAGPRREALSLSPVRRGSSALGRALEPLQLDDSAAWEATEKAVPGTFGEVFPRGGAGAGPPLRGEQEGAKQVLALPQARARARAFPI